jgi:DNA processing protein
MDSKVYWVGFNIIKGIGAVRMKGLLNYFGNAELAWEASADALREAGLGKKILVSFLRMREQIDLEKVWEHIQNEGITVYTWDDEGYPARLRKIDSSPPVIYVKGSLLEDDNWAVAIVGTRRMTSYGKQVTYQIASALASNGITVVSGMARGVDAVAHRAALSGGGRTLAVLGSGVDRIYPPEHRQLAEDIITNGALISDYAPGTPPEGGNFPPRNRIISALSKAVIVIEAGKQSGALITAAFAAEQGREVFAVPGNIYAPLSKGPNLLIQQGAHTLLEIDDVLETLNMVMVGEQRKARAVLPTNALEAKLYQIIGDEPLHVDEIRARSELPINQVSSTLALMELKGMVRQVGNMNYIAVRESRSDYQVGE